MILKVENYKMEVLTVSMVSTGSIIILATLDLPKCDDNNVSLELPIVDITKLQRVCEFADSEELILDIVDNVIKFNGSSVKLKLHMSEKSIITVPSHVTADKFRSFVPTFKSVVSHSVLNNLIKGQAFLKNSITDLKLYFYVENSEFFAELTDYQTSHSDSFKIKLTDTYEGTLISKVPIKADAWNLLNIVNPSVEVNAMTVNRKSIAYNIMFISQSIEGLSYTYMLQGLQG